MTKDEAIKCFQSYNGQVCGGCHMDSVCGQGENTAKTLNRLLNEVLEIGQGVTVVQLKPLGVK